MNDYLTSIEKLRREAVEAALIRDRTTDAVKRELYNRLHQHFNNLADEIERVAKNTAG